ncbi:hypothetical protein [Neptunomonas antarctica]|uniref:Uncharacterized protein n=1 Tax=Neptunomonas antarctica TaxID=619304 RepID=A0A1N7LM59_9GAMM|nr:hypothetical protein [Neptunomonas antarctica]SIS74874.1 hypothetical protein SAMN05421760_104148 [Neptunomonas antarctica]
MHTNLKSLQEDARRLQAGLEAVAAEMSAYENNLGGIQACALKIQKCARVIGNNRIAAVAAKDKRKIMAELEDAAIELVELLKR